MFWLLTLPLFLPQTEAPIGRQLPWRDFVARRFDPALCLPEPSAAERNAGRHPVTYLPRAMEERLARNFARTGEVWRFGDLVKELRPYHRDREAFARRLGELRERLPGLDERTGAWLGELILDRRLYRKDWDPDDDDDPEDGILMGERWELDRETPGRAPFWRQRGGNGWVHQLAVLYFADAEAVAATDCDLDQYRKHAGNEYTDIHAVPGSLVRGRDPAGHPYTYYQVFFNWDLDFPFGTYDCDLDVYIHFDGAGHLVTDTCSRGGDLHWAASRDLFLPVVDRDGAWICTLMVQQFGLDIDGVPEGEGDRIAAYRGMVGSKKRYAESRFRARGGKSRNPAPWTLPPLPIPGLEQG